ncbi:MAG: DegV family protein, partial [Finegoldia magna]|nr:DegV family protein [Finegoldia magna]
SGLSSSYDNAQLAINMLREDYPDRKILLVDSKAATNCQSLLVDIAVEMKKDGKSIEEVAEKMTELSYKYDVDFMVSDLFFLEKGGRISKSQAILGTALNINPILTLNQMGKIVQTDKVRTRKKAINKVVKKFIDNYDRDFKSKVFLSHGNSEKDAIYLRDKLLEYDKDLEIVFLNESITIASHTGPGTLLLAYISKNSRPE